LGEGKPENQNHAIIFTRGEMLQAIDMNQEGYIEEGFKMRNLLQEFDRNDGDDKPTCIVGFREHVFTGGLSSAANCMALQEGCFVTLGQRVLSNPLQMRLHYGHPDVFDKLFFLSRGGVSKAAKGINLSEDIFAGFNAVLRGGTIRFEEYMQVGKGRDVGLQQLFQFEAKLAAGAAMQAVSRDANRLARSLDISRLFSFFYGGIGFYISMALTITALFLFAYARVFVTALGWEATHDFAPMASLNCRYC
jgi:callose synthase